MPDAGERISHYRLLEILGRGAMGEIWLAEDVELPRQVAIKLLPERSNDDTEAVERMLREARAAASIDHPNVVVVYEAGLHFGRPFIVMQRLEGETLAERLTRGPLEGASVIALGLELADALSEVHALGIVHRDLKPANVMLTSRGAKILDFGIASVQQQSDLTEAGILLGTPRAMSPEQIEGRAVDSRSDLWALGVCLYRAATGHWPFDGATREALFGAIVSAEPVPARVLVADLDPALDAVISRLLQKRPERRYQRAEEVQSGLRGRETPSVAPRKNEAALAVLRFEVIGDDSGSHMALGLTEDLLVDLSRLSGLRVSSRADVARYEGRAVPPRTLGRELGVEHVLLGTVRHSGARARISAQLVRTRDGTIQWAARYDRTLDDLFEVQAEVSRAIVDALAISLSPGESEMLRRAPTTSPEAYQLYLQARERLQGALHSDNVEAERRLREALSLDPMFALAHAALGECLAARVMWSWSDMELMQTALTHAHRARELDPGLPDADRVELIVRHVNNDAPGVLQTLAHVLAHNPKDPEAREWAAWSDMALGRPRDALKILESLVEERPDQFRALSRLVACYEMLGKKQEAKTRRQELRDLLVDIVHKRPNESHPRSVLASILAKLGESEAALAQATRAIETSGGEPRVLYNSACVYALCGRSEEAILRLQEVAKDRRSFLANWPRFDPDLAALRSHPEFVRLFGEVDEERTEQL